MLVVQQHESEIMAPLHRASIWGGLVLLLSVVLIVVTTFVATRHLVDRIAVANEERDRMSRDLLRSAKLASLGELSTGLAHEINNPLAIIGTEMTNIRDIESMRDGEDPCRDEILESVERCSRQVTRCSAITSKMLQFGREGVSLRQPTDIGPKLVEITELMRKQAQVRNVDLDLVVEPDLPAVDLDPTELQQVIVNLINNSLYAIDGGGLIVIRASVEGDEVVVSVHDTGSGIAPEDLDRVFQPFFSTKPVGKGTGLGLSVCFGIVRGWGGTIEAGSRPGEGTTMTIRLPLRGAATSEVRA
jgi:two-component system NtrC family sensor kinase